MQTKRPEEATKADGGDDTPSGLMLSTKAREELRGILVRDTDPETIEKLTDADLDHFGCFLLTLFAEAAKLKANTGL